MNPGLATLTARRKALQARCELQRDEIRLLYAGIEYRAGRADRVVQKVRGFAPVIGVGGIVVMIAFGPRRILNLLRRTLTIGLYANSARQALKGSLAASGVRR